jgi:hypothetical protein
MTVIMMMVVMMMVVMVMFVAGLRLNVITELAEEANSASRLATPSSTPKPHGVPSTHQADAM